MRSRFWIGMAGVAGAAVLATGGAALAADQLGSQGSDAPAVVTSGVTMSSAMPLEIAGPAHGGVVALDAGDLDLTPQDRERLEELEAELQREIEALEKAEPGIKAEIDRIEGELDTLFGSEPKELTDEQEAQAERLFDQLERQYELAEERHPERVERIEAIEDQIGELLPFDEECFDGDHGDEGEGGNAEPDDSETEQPEGDREDGTTS